MPTDNPPGQFAFETERLRMRPLADEDEALFRFLYTDADTMRFIGEPLSQESAARCFRTALAASGKSPPQSVFWAILEKTTQRRLGICAIVQFDAALARAEVGMMLAPEARARGYSKECLAKLVTRTFAMFPIDEVWVQYSSGHSAAERLVISIDFSRGTDIDPGDGSPAKRFWSVRRPSRGSINAANNQGKDNVERDRFSGKNGAGRAIASCDDRGN